jgi:hypothetical protein
MWSKLMQISDEQRCERLQKCQDLTSCVRNCLQRQRDAMEGKAVSLDTEDLERYAVGVRMMRYFDWRDSEPIRVLGDRGHSIVAPPESTERTSDVRLPPTCAREVHAQWACRAISLACSPDLIQLKNCFATLGKEQVVSVPFFAYAPGDEGKHIPCRELQEKLGKCVAERAAELEQRVNARKAPASVATPSQTKDA